MRTLPTEPSFSRVPAPTSYSKKPGWSAEVPCLAFGAVAPTNVSLPSDFPLFWQSLMRLMPEVLARIRLPTGSSTEGHGSDCAVSTLVKGQLVLSQSKGANTPV